MEKTNNRLMITLGRNAGASWSASFEKEAAQKNAKKTTKKNLVSWIVKMENAVDMLKFRKYAIHLFFLYGAKLLSLTVN